MTKAFGCVASRFCDRLAPVPIGHEPVPANEVEIDILFRAGGSRETPEVPDIRSERGTRSDSELIPMADVDIAVARIDSGDVRFRRVIASHDEEMADAA